jgi:TatD DNase family protein
MPAPAISWVDTHCHLDAAEFAADADAVAARARAAGVALGVLPAVEAAGFDAVRALAHRHGWGYALGIHPLYADRAGADDLDRLRAALAAQRDDPHLLAVGEIGLDHYLPPPPDDPQRERQRRCYLAQLKLARAAGLPVILHVRRSADALLAGLRRIEVCGGIAHAFNGSPEQALQFLARGFALGFGGAMTYERALRIRALAATLPETAPVLETDAPDIPPQWLLSRSGSAGLLRPPRGADRATGPVLGAHDRSAAQRAAGAVARNEPAELPRIGATLAALRGWSLAHTAAVTAANAQRVLPRLAALRAAAPAVAAA